MNLLIDLDELKAELAAIEAESIGWQPLGDGAYLHLGDPEGAVITIVGVPDAGMAGMNVLLVVVSYRLVWSCAGVLIPI